MYLHTYVCIGIKYEYKAVHLLKDGGEHKKDVYAALNPMKEVWRLYDSVKRDWMRGVMRGVMMKGTFTGDRWECIETVVCNHRVLGGDQTSTTALAN